MNIYGQQTLEALIALLALLFLTSLLLSSSRIIQDHIIQHQQQLEAIAQLQGCSFQLNRMVANSIHASTLSFETCYSSQPYTLRLQDSNYPFQAPTLVSQLQIIPNEFGKERVVIPIPRHYG